jgi:CheY-like chemotaxis protein
MEDSSMKRVLLADDSVAARKSIQTVLEVAGIDVVAVGNGDLALARIEEVAPEMVLLDAIMPGRTGYDVCAELKRDVRFSTIPVLLITSEFEPFDARHAEESGADGHLLKPFDVNAITVMRDVWARYAPGDSEGLAAVAEAEADPEDVEAPPDAHSEPVPPVQMPGPESFITATMRAIDIEMAEAERKALEAAASVDTIPAGSGRPKAREAWGAAVPDHVVDGADAPPPRRAPTTENLELEVAPDGAGRGHDHDTVRHVSLDSMRTAGDRCLDCAAALTPGDIFCIACGAMVLVTNEEADRIARAQHCAECNQELLPGEIFCVACGAVV